MNLGFVGTGFMGEPIARRLLQAGARLQVWNRTPAKCAHLARLGATLSESVAGIFDNCEVIFLMLRDAQAIDAALAGLALGPGADTSGRTIINLGTCSPAYSQALAARVQASGGRYVEAPVSGSRVQAEQGRLVAMLAGDTDALELAQALLAPVVSRSFRCGASPEAMRLKLAVNHFLIVMVAGLTEAVDGARAAGIDLHVMREVLDAGPMASEVSRIKMGKLVAADFAPQAAIGDVRVVAGLTVCQAQESGAPAPLMRTCLELYQRAELSGRAGLDMIAIGAAAA